GVLERPDLPHSSSNRFISRYAYLVIPASKTLDANYVHNYSKLLNRSMNAATGDGFMRNQGVGTWEVNFAGFLADLNTNYWPTRVGTTYGTPYVYSPFNPTQPNRGAAFDDALSFVRYRYANNYDNLQSLRTFFGNDQAAIGAVSGDFIDAYSRGPIM